MVFFYICLLFHIFLLRFFKVLFSWFCCSFVFFLILILSVIQGFKDSVYVLLLLILYRNLIPISFILSSTGGSNASAFSDSTGYILKILILSFYMPSSFFLLKTMNTVLHQTFLVFSPISYLPLFNYFWCVLLGCQ